MIEIVAIFCCALLALIYVKRARKIRRMHRHALKIMGAAK